MHTVPMQAWQKSVSESLEMEVYVVGNCQKHVEKQFVSSSRQPVFLNAESHLQPNTKTFKKSE